MTDITFSKVPADAAECWQVVRSVIAGDQAMRKGGFLPYLNAADLSAENRARNESYVERAVFYGATGRTLQGLLGLAFRKDPRAELPAELQYLVRNCDGRKSSLYQQSQAAVIDVLSAGRHGLYVDYDEAKGRPVIKPYKAESIINWRFGERLELLVLAEVVEEADGYGVKIVEQYRELALEDSLLVCRVWRKSEKDDWQVAETAEARSKAKRLDFIPFQFIGSANNDAEIDPVPLYDLARLNVAHYCNSADYEDSGFRHGQPQFWISGLTDEWRDHLEQSGHLYVGAPVAMLLPEGGSCGYAQVLPNTMAKEMMEQKESYMVALGARLMDQNAVRVTATQSDNDRETSTSVLSMCVANVNEAYQQCIAWCAVYLDKPLDEKAQAASYKISQDYARVKIDPQAVTALVAAWQSGAIGKVDLRAYLRAEGILATERTDEEIDGDLEIQGPALGAAGEA